MHHQQTLTDSPRPRLWLFCPGSSFVLPYFERHLGSRYDIDTSPDGHTTADHAIMISSVDIYDVDRGTGYNELTPIYAESPWNSYERHFTDLCLKAHVTPVILRCAHIVGTGMTGPVMNLVKALDKGIARHITPPTETVISLVHAVDLPVITDMLLQAQQAGTGTAQIYNVTDGQQTDTDALIEALAHRLNDKRIASVKRRWARWLMGKTIYRFLSTTLTFSDDRLHNAINYQPTAVTNYLLTHIYDHDSL